MYNINAIIDHGQPIIIDYECENRFASLVNEQQLFLVLTFPHTRTLRFEFRVVMKIPRINLYGKAFTRMTRAV